MKSKFINTKDTISRYLKSGNKKSQIIALLMKAKGCDFENQDQVNGFYKRHSGRAKELSCYGLNKIIQTMEYLVNNADYKWTLETVLKHIDEDLDILSGKKPIIILQNGERIYDTTKVRELEKAGRIYYTGSGWCEVHKG